MAETTASSTLAAAATKPVTSYLDEWQRQQAAKAAKPDSSIYGQFTATAAQSLADAASGKTSPALQAATQASREALSRQSNNQRMATATAVSKAGQIGQGNAFGATQATENKIASDLASSRLAETQALASEQSTARNQLLSAAQQESQQNKSSEMQALTQLLANGTAAQKLQAQAGIQALSGTAPGANTDEINEAAYQEAINDPTYQAQQNAAKLANLTSTNQLAAAELAQQTQGRKLIAQSNNKRSTNYVEAQNYVPGQAVEVDGKAVKYLGKEVIDQFSNILGSTYKIYRFKFQDPATGQIVTKDESWNKDFQRG